MKKKVLGISLILLVIGVGNAFAAGLGNIQYWYSDKSEIGRWGTTPKVWYGTLDSSMTQLTLDGHVTHARSQWNSAGVTNSYTSDFNSSHIRFRSGTYTSIKKIEPGIENGDTGLTKRSPATEFLEGYWYYLGNYPKSGKKISGPVYIYLVTGNRTSAAYRNTATHELGHGLGYFGHSSNKKNVMYGAATEITTLTSDDKVHLNQIYK